MNQGFDPKEIAKVKEQCKKQNQPFVITKNNLKEEGHANFLFIGNYEGKEVVYDGFIYPLEVEYYSGIYETAREMVIENIPEFANADFNAQSGQHIEMLVELAEELAKDTDFNIAEFVETDEDSDYGIAVDACLNVDEITEQTIADFVNDFNAGKLELDTTAYSFIMEK